jgi:predicted amidohydrolase YtcJ
MQPNQMKVPSMRELLDLIIQGNILTMYDARPRVEAVGVKNGRIANWRISRC